MPGEALGWLDVDFYDNDDIHVLARFGSEAHAFARDMLDAYALASSWLHSAAAVTADLCAFLPYLPL